MGPRLFAYAWTVAAIFALLVALPVLRDIAKEGLERHRERRSAGEDPHSRREDAPTTDRDTEATAGERTDVTPADARRCRHCGTVNAPAYRYCRACGQRL